MVGRMMIYHKEFHDIIGPQWCHSHFCCQSDFASRKDDVTSKLIHGKSYQGQFVINFHFIKGDTLTASIVHQHPFEAISGHHCPLYQGITVKVIYLYYLYRII